MNTTVLHKTILFGNKTKTDVGCIIELSIDASSPVFEGHFPGNPILPGVVMLAIVKEAVKQQVGFNVQLAAASNLKFLSFINPTTTPHVFLNLELEPTEAEIKVNASLLFEDAIFFKMKGSYAPVI